jgi:hypothetical protein
MGLRLLRRSRVERNAWSHTLASLEELSLGVSNAPIRFEKSRTQCPMLFEAERFCWIFASQLRTFQFIKRATTIWLTCVGPRSRYISIGV